MPSCGTRRKSSQTKAAIAVLKQQQKLDHCQVAVERFVERELIELLAQSPEWDGGAAALRDAAGDESD